MPRTCTICTHPDCAAIDDALIAGAPYRSIAQRFAASPDAVYRHKLEHLPSQLVKAHAAAEVAVAVNLLARLDQLTADAQRIGQKAEQARNYTSALAAVRELVRIVELTAKLRGELQQEGTTHITVHAAWHDACTVLMTALAPYPDARMAAAHALLEAERALP